MNNELIQQARELCEKAETEFWYVKDSRWHCGKPILTQLCDALEAMTARAEKTEAERDKIASDMKYYLDVNEDNGVVYIPKFAVEKIIRTLIPKGE